MLAPLVSLALVLPALAMAPASAAPPLSAACSADILLSHTTVSVIANGAAPTEAHASATVVVSKPPLITVHVLINGSTDIGWDVDVTPASEVVNDEDDGVISVGIVVTVPPGTPAGSKAQVTITTEPDAGRYPCSGDTSSALEVLAAPKVARFEGYIVGGSLNVSEDARHIEFRVEIEAEANVPIHVSVTYLVEPRAQVDGPSALDLSPEVEGRDNATLGVTILSSRLPPGTYEFSMHVVGEAEGYPPLQGDLGFTYHIPSGHEGPPTPPLLQFSSWVELLLLVAGVAVAVAVGAPLYAVYRARHRRLERRRRLLTLRRVAADYRRRA